MENLIAGFKEIKETLGYDLTFHDDNIEKIVIDNGQIEIILKSESQDGYSLVFKDVKKFELKGDMIGTIGIVLDLEVEEIDGMLNTTMTSSLGTEGQIISKKVSCRLLKLKGKEI